MHYRQYVTIQFIVVSIFTFTVSLFFFQLDLIEKTAALILIFVTIIMLCSTGATHLDVLSRTHPTVADLRIRQLLARTTRMALARSDSGRRFFVAGRGRQEVVFDDTLWLGVVKPKRFSPTARYFTGRKYLYFLFLWQTIWSGGNKIL